VYPEKINIATKECKKDFPLGKHARNTLKSPIPEGKPKPSVRLELRQHERSHARDLSEIILANRKFGIACMIHDISESGARLEVGCGELPKRFVLVNYTKKSKTLCEMVWRDRRLLGVKFLTKPRPFALEERL
jgi:hypothetical protein